MPATRSRAAGTKRGLAAETAKVGDNAEAFREGHRDDAQGQDVAESAGVAADGFHGLGADHADAKGGGGTADRHGQVAGKAAGGGAARTVVSSSDQLPRRTITLARLPSEYLAAPREQLLPLVAQLEANLNANDALAIQADIDTVTTAFEQVLAERTRTNKVTPDELSGGTFTISNGGVYGSLMSTPILNATQSGILGMHTIQKRPVAVDGQVVIRPMMNLALSYDHRLVDGKEAVTFLVKVKQAIEDPARLLIGA
jgi:hypothetical protein